MHIHYTLVTVYILAATGFCCIRG